MEKLYNLFTYGTLMQGFENPYAHKLRNFAAYVEKGYFSGQLYRIEWYPGAIYDPASPNRVHGEIYRLTSLDVLADLDRYEDVLEDEAASLYLRKVVPVYNVQGKAIPCWTYLYNKAVEDLPLIEDGHFKIRP